MMRTLIKYRRPALIVASLVFTLALAGCPYLEPWDLRPAASGEHWLRFVQVTDIHIVDDESPARIVKMDSYKAGAWRPQEAYAAQVLDATCRLINRIHYGGQLTGHGPVDFVLVTGDVAENAQYNEVRWFIDTMDGGWVTPDSGDLDGPQRPIAAEINPHLPFKAAGLAKDIPWYVLIGNHDNLCVGNFSIDRTSPDPEEWRAPVGPVVGSFLGLPNLSPPQDALIPTGDQSLAILRAGDPEPIDPHTYQLDMDLLQAGPITPDPNRHFMSKRLFIAEHFKTRSFPGGHGFDATSTLTGEAHYTFRPKRDVPVRVIVIDSVGPDAVPGYLGASGAVALAEFEGFLKPQIRAAKAAGEYVILATHHPSIDIKKPTLVPCVTAEVFTSYLASQPNILAHICGHMHYHDVIMHAGPYPYPEFLTASLIDYPQQVRMLDVYYDSRNKTFELRSTFLSHTDDPTRLSEESYVRMTADMMEDPDGSEWAQRMSHLDLTGIESYLLDDHGAKADRHPADAQDAYLRDEQTGPRTLSVSVRRPDLKESD